MGKFKDGKLSVVSDNLRPFAAPLIYGKMKKGSVLRMMENNLLKVPIVKKESKPTDFLLIKYSKKIRSFLLLGVLLVGF